ncbi:MAG: CDP-alcohol phosphatidyltransferase family protein [Oscillospiraceae bacterium]|nr:CDP-alcohol phosphatidyltransferase family protein [Oscillospiraceae bacterium]
MKKHLANIVSLSRVAGAIVLFFCDSISTLFLVVYIFCGFTDLIDGPIARKTNSASTLGASLDTIGDVLTYLALTKILIMKKAVPPWILAWILGAGVVFGVCAVISRIRFKKLYLPHTYIGKLFGASVFVLPVAMQFMAGSTWMAVICSIASIHAVELLYIQSRNKTAEDFIPTVFHVKKA